MFVIAGVLVPPIIYFFTQGWLHFIRNDCLFFQDIKKINIQQNKHNQELMKIKE